MLHVTLLTPHISVDEHQLRLQEFTVKCMKFQLNQLN